LVTKRNAIVTKCIEQNHIIQTKTKDMENDQKANTDNNNSGHSSPNKNQSTGGIIDVAGRAGHFSFALALRTIYFTVVDPCSTVSQLQGRNWKVLKKSMQE